MNYEELVMEVIMFENNDVLCESCTWHTCGADNENGTCPQHQA